MIHLSRGNRPLARCPNQLWGGGVHISAVERAGLQGLREGQKISYDVQVERGKEAAANLKA
jgi:hypothetical protein